MSREQFGKGLYQGIEQGYNQGIQDGFELGKMQASQMGCGAVIAFVIVTIGAITGLCPLF